MEYPRIDPEFKAEWVHALRSGEFKQAYECMVDRVNEIDCYCAIGVAYKLKHPEWNLFQYIRKAIGYTKDAAAEIGLHESAWMHICGMNDGERMPFMLIADWIEINL